MLAARAIEAVIVTDWRFAAPDLGVGLAGDGFPCCCCSGAPAWDSRWRLVNVERTVAEDETTLLGGGRALNWRRRAASSSSALSRAASRSFAIREYVSPGSSKLGTVGGLLDRMERARWGGELASASFWGSSCMLSRAAFLSFSSLATLSPGNSKVETVGGLLAFWRGFGGARLAGRGTFLVGAALAGIFSPSWSDLVGGDGLCAELLREGSTALLRAEPWALGLTLWGEGLVVSAAALGEDVYFLSETWRVLS